MPLYLETFIPPLQRDLGPIRLRWFPTAIPGRGVVELAQKRSVTQYTLAEAQTDWDGRAFVFCKVDGYEGTDEREGGYSVFCARNGQDSYCDCKGFTRWGHCKHLRAVRELMRKDWLAGDLYIDNGEQNSRSMEVFG
jgi:hypothetical protein